MNVATVYRNRRGLFRPTIKEMNTLSFGLYSRIFYRIEPKAVVPIPVNLTIELPVEYVVIITGSPKSTHNKLLTIPDILTKVNKSEVEVSVLNLSESRDIILNKGDQIAEATVLQVCNPSPRFRFEEKIRE